MSKKINDGGPAFPASAHAGMTLRDYFAAKAMQGLIAAETSGRPISHIEMVIEAYMMAGAMLAAREGAEE